MGDVRGKLASASGCFAWVLLSLATIWSQNSGAEQRSLWIAQSQGLLEIDLVDAGFASEIELDRVAQAVSVDVHNGRVWSVGNGDSLYRFDTAGDQLSVTEIPGLALGQKRIAADAVGNVWVAVRNRVLLFDSAGVFVSEFEGLNALENVRAVAMDLTRSRFWVAAAGRLLAFGPDGAFLFEVDVDGLGLSGVRDIAWDVATDSLWLAGNILLRRYDADGGQIAEVSIPSGTDHIAPDGNGGVWLATGKLVHYRNAAGEIALTLEPWGPPLLTLESTSDLVADPANHSAWIVSGRRALQYAPDGEVLANVPRDINDGPFRVFRGLSNLDEVDPPTITAVEPIVGSTLSDIAQPLRYEVSDAGAGAAPGTLHVVANGADATDRAQLVDGELTLPAPTSGWSAGNLSVSVSMSDRLGNQRTEVFDYLVQPQTTALFDAVPGSGQAPLTVQFTPTPVTGGAIEEFEWDFDGDGDTDRQDTIGNSYSWHYQEPGEYEARLTVTDNTDVESEATRIIQVTNGAPEVSASASPSNGIVPLTVDFSATATDNEGIDTYEWDFEGDGVYDTEDTQSQATHVYDQQGSFQPALRVTDALGASTTVTVPTIEVEVAAPGSPSVELGATPSEGATPLTVQLDANATDPDGESITEYAWDFDGDGTLDATGSASSQSHTYEARGTFFPAVHVTAADGGMASDAVEVRATSAYSLDVTTGTIDPAIGESTAVETTLGGRTEVSVLIEDRGGRNVRTLVPPTERAAGTYSDVWDGSRDNGETVAEGDYYAVLRYEVDGEAHRLDLRETTGGARSNPSRSELPDTFSPFAGDPLEIDFTLDRAAEVTAFMGRYDVNTRLVTFFQRRPLGKGTHRIVWNGANNEGQLIHPPPGDEFLFGIFRYTLADNAIYVRSGAHLTTLQVAPPILAPDATGDEGQPARSRISFDLSAPADVELLVQDADSGAAVARRQYQDLDAGPNTVTWNGKDDDGFFLAPGRYRLALTATDDAGYRAITRYALQRIYY